MKYCEGTMKDLQKIYRVSQQATGMTFRTQLIGTLVNRNVS